MMALPIGAIGQPASKPERRVAFVVGIGAYQHAPRLANPVNDARAIGESLRRLGFEVDEAYDSDFRHLTRALREFGIKAQQADVAVVYYAGHGVQVARENYLLPADAMLERERDLVYESLPLELFLGEISQARKLGIILLDACRNNPFVDRLMRSMTVASRGPPASGLARVDAVPRNTLVAMATKADQTAEDGSGGHSPFAQALIENLGRPGLELSLFFRSVRDGVLKQTNNTQEPYVFSSLGAEPFYFHPRAPNQPPRIGPIAPLEVRDNAAPILLPIPRPTDPDQDPLTVRITGMPRSGEMRIEGRLVTPGAVFSVESFATATYKPTGTAIGDVGAIDILVEDGRGGSVLGSLPIIVVASNRAPVVEARRRLRIYTGALGVAPPTDPDGDKLTVTVESVPRGLLRFGVNPIRPGDRLEPEQLPALTYVPEPGFSGPAGTFRYLVDDGRGGRVDGVLDVDVMDPSEAVAQMAEAALWERLRATGRLEDVETFLRIYPSSYLAAAARHRRNELAAAAAQSVASAGSPPASAPQVGAHPPPVPPAAAPAETPTSSPPPRVAARPPVTPPAAAPAETPTPTHPPAVAAPLPVTPLPPTPVEVPTPSHLASRAPGSPPPAAPAKTLTPETAAAIPPPAPLPTPEKPGAPNKMAALQPIVPPTVLPSPGAPQTTAPPAPAEPPARRQDLALVVPPVTAPSDTSDGRVFQDCPTCVQMVRIPAGTFVMGQGSKDPTAVPAHKVVLRAFALSAYPVTVADWKTCHADAVCGLAPHMAEARDDLPIHNVSWDDAQLFITWISRRGGHTYRLPSEAEWEYAARAGTTSRFWWGDSPGIALANCAGCGGPQDPKAPLPVSTFRPNPFGLYGMLGGVAQWVQDCWAPNYTNAPTDGSARRLPSCVKHVLRGGSFRASSDDIMPTARANYDGPVRYLENGFRVARDLE